MVRTFSALTTAAVFAFTLPALAQSSATTTAQKSDRYDTSKEITLTGCVEKNKSGGHFLTEAMMSQSPSSTTGTTGTAPATTTAEHNASNTWNLENESNLDQYVGQKVQVTGFAEKSTSGDELKGTTGKEIQARDFDVKSIKMVASSCK